MHNGAVIWITGLAGSGKTTIAKNVIRALKQNCSAVISLDGDELRNAIAPEVGYSKEERKILSFKYAKLCKLLADQGAIVVWSGIAMFDEVREWNRHNIANYFEVYIKVPFEELKVRNQKNLYNSNNSALDQIVGIDILPEEPKHPDIIVPNFGDWDISKSTEYVMEAILESGVISFATQI